MAQNVIKIAIRPDLDIRETCEGILTLVHLAYDHGVISWERRGEMLGDPFVLVTVRNYDVPCDELDTAILGLFIEPSAAFLAEIGLLTP